MRDWFSVMAKDLYEKEVDEVGAAGHSQSVAINRPKKGSVNEQ